MTHLPRLMLVAIGVLTSAAEAAPAAMAQPPNDPPKSAAPAPAAATPAATPQGLALVEALESVMTDVIARAEPSVVAIQRFRPLSNAAGKDGDKTLAVRGRMAPIVSRVQRPGIFMLEEDNGSDGEAPFDYGSGVVVGAEGQILTAFHVVQGASRIVVRAVGRKEFEAEILAADPRSDLAVIQPRTDPRQKPPELVPIALGKADKLRKGSFVIALGNPFDTAWDGRAAAGWGILSNTARRLNPPSSNTGERVQLQLRHYPTLLQLDTKLNLGMSGGAVVNLRGELIGITTAAANPASFDAQAGYAIPLDRMGLRVLQSLIQGKEVQYGFLGIGLDEEGTTRIRTVTPDTPAERGGLLTDDLVMAVGGIPVANSEELVVAINEMPVGKPVKLTIKRGDLTADKEVVMSKLKISGEVISTNRPPAWRGIRVDYTSALFDPFGDHILQEMKKGLVAVAEIEAQSAAETAGLRVGQIIRKMGDRDIRTPEDFYDAVKDAKGPVDLLTESGPVTIP